MDSTTTPDGVEVSLAKVRARLREELITGVNVATGLDVPTWAGTLRDLAETYVRLGGDLELEQPAIRAELDEALRHRAALTLAAGKVLDVAAGLGGDTFEGRLEELKTAIMDLELAVEAAR
jgi:hypothetical protein